MRRCVKVPLIGKQAVEDWTKVPHVMCWGIWDEDALTIDVIHVENAGAPTIHVPVTLFESEQALMMDIDDDTTLPDVVCQRLAVMALNPVRED